jgi:FAD synthetase
MAKKKRVLVFGTFDLIHPGHLHFLKKAKKQGDELVVVVARDETVKEVKGEEPLYDEDQRKEAVEYLGIADKVSLGNRVDKYGVVRRFSPDVICLGYDQTHFVSGLERTIKKLEKKPKIVRISAYKPKKYKSSILKRKK